MHIKVLSWKSLVMLRQQSYAIKNQLIASKTRNTFLVFCLLIGSGSLWHKDCWLHAQKGPIIGANENVGYTYVLQQVDVVLGLVDQVANRLHPQNFVVGAKVDQVR